VNRWLHGIARLTPVRVLAIFIVLWLGVAVLLASFHVSMPWIIAYGGVTLIYAFFVAGWAMMRMTARLRGVMDEGETPDGGLLLEALPQAVMIADDGGKVRAVNNAWLDLFVLSRSSTWNKNYKRFADPVLRGHLDRVRKTKEAALDLNLSTRLPDGANLSFMADLTPYGEGVLAAARPTTKPGKGVVPYLAVDRYRQLGRLAEHALSFLQRELRAMAETQASCAERLPALLQMMDDLQAVAEEKAETIEALDLRRLLARVQRTVAPFLADKGLKLTAAVAEDLPGARGRAAHLRYVLLALVIEALAAAPPGGEVRLSAQRGGEEIRIAVEDEGAALDENAAQNLFTPFADEQRGPGFAVARQIAREHGGDLHYEPREGSGRRFVLYLPWEKAES